MPSESLDELHVDAAERTRRRAVRRRRAQLARLRRAVRVCTHMLYVKYEKDEYETTSKYIAIRTSISCTLYEYKYIACQERGALR